MGTAWAKEVGDNSGDMVENSVLFLVVGCRACDMYFLMYLPCEILIKRYSITNCDTTWVDSLGKLEEGLTSICMDMGLTGKEFVNTQFEMVGGLISGLSNLFDSPYFQNSNNHYLLSPKACFPQQNNIETVWIPYLQNSFIKLNINKFCLWENYAQIAIL